MKEVMKIRRSRKGAYDKRMRRSTRNTTTLILDLVTLTPAAMCPSPPITSVYAHLRAAHRRFNSPRFAPTRLRSLCFPLATYICCSPHCLANCFHCLLSSDIRLMQYVRAFPIPENAASIREKRTSRDEFLSLSLYGNTLWIAFSIRRYPRKLTPLDASITHATHA